MNQFHCRFKYISLIELFYPSLWGFIIVLFGYDTFSFDIVYVCVCLCVFFSLFLSFSRAEWSLGMNHGKPIQPLIFLHVFEFTASFLLTTFIFWSLYFYILKILKELDRKTKFVSSPAAFDESITPTSTPPEFLLQDKFLKHYIKCWKTRSHRGVIMVNLIKICWRTSISWEHLCQLLSDFIHMCAVLGDMFIYLFL